MDTTINYQALAMNIVMAAIEDVQHGDEEAADAQAWLNTVDIGAIGVDGITIDELICINTSGY